MFPANRKTLLPMHFSAIPFISYSVNDRISNNLIQEQILSWLDFWQRLFGYQIALQEGQISWKLESYTPSNINKES
jgi:hypothetical protein